MRPKEIDRSGLQPSRHFSGTEGLALRRARQRRTPARREEGEDWCEMGRRTTAQWSVSGDFLRQLERFLPSKVDRVGYISENRNTADGSEWRAGERVQGHWW